MQIEVAPVQRACTRGTRGEDENHPVEEATEREREREGRETTLKGENERTKRESLPGRRQRWTEACVHPPGHEDTAEHSTRIPRGSVLRYN